MMICKTYYVDKVVTLAIPTHEIEAAISRCGWAVLNKATEITPADQAEIERIQDQGFASVVTRADVSQWWLDHVVREEPWETASPL